ncbi:hypothetical protein [Sinorhizobium meliloti]|uniref:hypothetical protein n=1 Tax=Rhizobium meliloti TaxID=382 RepID=UPI000FDA54B7|nr:hypothetical protein [Sinorhizobium meliloti]RVE79008.1 hypothetical protein CN238_33480 [Sinorhizobium meliloti]RVH19839.1 hypothetical protein CN214_33105 [Sinorhizobium meliloti]
MKDTNVAHVGANLASASHYAYALDASGRKLGHREKKGRYFAAANCRKDLVDIAARFNTTEITSASGLALEDVG